MEVKAVIQKEIEVIVSELTGQSIQVQLQKPADQSHGDYTTNIAMQVFSVAKKTDQKLSSPIILAGKIKEKFDSLLSIKEYSDIDKVEVVHPGFVNFFLSKAFLLEKLRTVSGAEFGKSKRLLGKKIMVEFTDPNPFKEFHIGHLYSNTVGESISRLLESQGATVWRVNYQGDVGMHVAKSIWGMKKLLEQRSEILSHYETKGELVRAHFLGEAYAYGAKMFEESESAKAEVVVFNKKIYAHDPEVEEFYSKGRAWSLEYFETLYKRLGTTFKHYYFESDAAKIGLEIVEKNVEGGIFKKDNGAIIFEGEKYGLHSRVFINSQGLPTYEAKDLGLAPTKYKDFPYELSIIITANEQAEYFKVLLKALTLVSPELGGKTQHMAHGVVKLPTGKMSSRTGDVITGLWLLDEAKKRIKESFKDMDEQVCEQVAIGAVKYALLRSSVGKDISFDFDESISLEGNSGPYLQYTCVRTQSILSKAKTTPSFQVQSAIDLEEEEIMLLRLLVHFAEVVSEASREFSPHIVCGYLFEAAKLYNLFYQKQQIIGSKQEAFRLALTAAVGNVLKTGLDVLGIQVPAKM